MYAIRSYYGWCLIDRHRQGDAGAAAGAFVVRHVITSYSIHYTKLYEWQDIRQLDLTGYQLVLSDFEPVTAWAARRQGLDSLGISHQAAFFWPIPRRFDDVRARFIMRP